MARDYEDLSQSIGACPTCRSVRYRATDAGAWVCEHGHQSQSIWTQDAAEDDGDIASASRTVRRALGTGRRPRRASRTANALHTGASEEASGPAPSAVVELALRSLLRAQLAVACAVWPGVALVAGHVSFDRGNAPPSGGRLSTRRRGSANTGSLPHGNTAPLDTESTSAVNTQEEVSFNASSDEIATHPPAVTPTVVPEALEQQCMAMWSVFAASMAASGEHGSGLSALHSAAEDNVAEESLDLAYGDVLSPSATAPLVAPRHTLAVLFLAMSAGGAPVLVADIQSLAARRVLPYNDCGPYTDGVAGAEHVSHGADAWALPEGMVDSLAAVGYRGLARRGVPPRTHILERAVRDVARFLSMHTSMPLPFPSKVLALRMCTELFVPPVFASVALSVTHASSQGAVSYASSESPTTALCAAFFASLVAFYNMDAASATCGEKRDAEDEEDSPRGKKQRDTYATSVPELLEAMPRRRDALGGMPCASRLLASWAESLSRLAPLAAAACGAFSDASLCSGASVAAQCISNDKLSAGHRRHTETVALLPWAAAREAIAIAAAVRTGDVDPHTLLPQSRTEDYFTASPQPTHNPRPTAQALRAIMAVIKARPAALVRPPSDSEPTWISHVPAAQRVLLLLIAALTGVPPESIVRTAWSRMSSRRT